MRALMRPEFECQCQCECRRVIAPGFCSPLVRARSHAPRQCIPIEPNIASARIASAGIALATPSLPQCHGGSAAAPARQAYDPAVAPSASSWPPGGTAAPGSATTTAPGSAVESPSRSGAGVPAVPSPSGPFGPASVDDAAPAEPREGALRLQRLAGSPLELCRGRLAETSCASHGAQGWGPAGG